jgi:peptidoglycan hydrolase CwlO-like protein
MPETPEDVFDRWGVAETRLRFQQGNLPPLWINNATKWLAAHDEQDRLLSEASQAEQARIARSAESAAWIAAKAAIIAAVISGLAWIFPIR